MRKLSFVFLVFLAFGFSNSHAQLKNFKKGLTSFQAGYYDLAIKEFLKVKEIDNAQQAELNFKIAEAYRLTNRWIESIPFYEKAFDSGLNNTDAIFYYAYALKANEEYAKAKIYLEKFIDAKSENKTLNERAQREMNTLLLISDIKSKTSELEFKNFSALNTDKIEFSGILKDGYFIFSASKKDKLYSNGLPFLGIYKAKVSPDFTTVGTPEPFSKNILDPDRNEGTPTFSPDGKTMIFARGNSGKRKDTSPDVDLYMSRYVANEGWTEPKLVSASDSLAWDGSPAFSRDGKTLYFSSNRAGGSGGLDIYRVNMDASGRFGNPANMGKAINTAGDEMFPYVSEDGKLYFASDGHPGLGKLDLFVAVRSGGKISVENLGLPYNSSMDDFGLSFDESGNIFFTSNREGGKGNDDIYYYLAPSTPDETVAKTDDPNDPSNPNNPNNKDGNDLKNQKIANYFLEGTVLGNKIPLDSSLVKIYKLESGIESDFAEVYTSQGKFGPVKMDEDEDYMILVEKSTYLTKREGFSMYGRSIPYPLLKKPVTDTTFKIEINLEQVFVGKTFRLENIYYDLDKYDIRSDAAVELDKLVQILKDNPLIKIELGSHTDSRGTDLYNIRLSQRRAESVINYLAIKGISKERLTAKGYGETELIISNAKTEEEHQVNRRTEFKVLEISSE
ncbi:flagellar motor protein MotB [Lacihabitans sp. LS3-19]|uniref:OmpA family protein n=1 Tax=Lacihabitans sp. LS3-19 TaxID=2487335 RepID=UPI0020CD1D3B|nr:OmpA family protein [Lacihabitans sp. LS3-19]MCP9766946.1 flagellar motor protein MotB [Lacihabitans sp. LS3-19]